ncbi:MAG: OmpA family protein [Thermodesulfobacteriota bacterium]
MGHRISHRPSKEALDVWPGFVDIMVGLLLIFIFFATLFIITETILARTLGKKDTELARISREIAEKDDLLKQTHARVDELKNALSKLKSLFGEKVKEVAGLREVVASTTRKLDEATTNADKTATLLKSREAELTSHAKRLEEAQAEIETKDRLFLGKTKELESALAKLSELTGLLASKETEAESGRKALDAAQTDLKEKSALLTQKDKELIEALARSKEFDALLKKKEEALASQQTQAETSASELEAKIARIRELADKLADMELKLTERDDSLAKSRKGSSEKSAEIATLKSQLAGLNKNIAELSKKVAQYVEQVAALNRRLADSKEREDQSNVWASSLQKEVTSLTAKLDEISKRIETTAKLKDPQEEFRLSQLVTAIGQKDKEIDRLRKLAKYRSEFLARLDEIFRGVPDIKVQGDRFVFQSEILFQSGKKDINENGKHELDKFIRIYKEMAPKIPKDLDLMILIQGHTDTDPVSPSSRFKSNWELSSARAMEVLRYMIKEGIPPTHVGAVALGEFQPVAEENTPEAKRLNRRIEIKITTL